MLSPIFLSFNIAIFATFLSFVFGVLFAYFLNKRNIPCKNIFETLIILPMIMPPSVVGYILLSVLGKKGIVGAFLLEHFNIQIVFTPTGAIIAAFIVSLPLMYQNAKAAFLSVNKEYEFAAKALGIPKFKTFLYIIFPLSVNGIVSGLILTFARALGEFGATLMIAGNIPGKTQTITTAIYFAVESGDMQTANILVIIMTVLSFVLIFSLNLWLKRKAA